MSRQVSWVRKASKSTLMAGTLPQEYAVKPVSDFSEMGFEQVVGEPLYDNGSYFVIDTVKDLQWAIMDNNFRQVKKVDLNKYEAFQLADDYKDADDRNGYNDGTDSHLH